MHIPLSKTAFKLIKDAAPNRLKGKIFYTHSAQKMNDYLKYICHAAGIDENRAKQVSLKTGRHTFATLTLKQSKSGAGLVITSYSIHYTKLYEVVLRG